MKFIQSKYFSFVLLFLSSHVFSQSSECYGISSDGFIKNSVQLPSEGDNYVIYHKFGSILGRNHVHSKVASILINSYEKIHQKHPDLVYKYAETGWKNGGNFKPHKTHQNGLSVDFMVPVRDEFNQSVQLPTTVSNKFGYAIEFNKKGEFKNYKIDYESMALHIVELDKEARLQGIKLKRVIFAPELRQHLFKTSQANYLNKNIVFMKNKAWVRHDEHYHIDFDIICKN
ncbi:MAG: penicillin-insensitive murein endopeptidase [Marinicellaceae bacterium]